MSSQTFDETYRLRMPELEQAILDEIARGSSLRRVAQVLCINRKTVSRRLERARRTAAGAMPIPAVAEATSKPRRSRRGSARKIV